MKATFLLSKDPSVESTGDLTMASLIMNLARESYDVDVICLSSDPTSRLDGHTRVAKNAPRSRELLIDSLRTSRSLVHTRFDIDGLVQAVDNAETDIFVADHSYMAESFLRSTRASSLRGGESILAVSTVVSETLVWKATRGLLGKLDSHRIIRDELRVARLAYSVGTYDEDEALFYAEHGVRRSHWLDLTLPPKKKVNLESAGRRLVFLGDRKWSPNQEAFELLLQWWPDIAYGIDGAELSVVGSPDPDKKVELPDGVRDLGFVDDLDAFLTTCRAMIAPIVTGGGVRVKILDAASRGMPIVGTSAAIGSLGPVLGIEGIDDKERFIESCRTYLLDRKEAITNGDNLFETNSDRWKHGLPHLAVQKWLAS